MGPSLICYQKRNKTNEQDDARRADGGVAVLVLQGQVLDTPTVVLQATGQTVSRNKEMVVNELKAVLQMTVGYLVALLTRQTPSLTAGAQAVNFSPTMPATMRPTQARRAAVAGSLKRTMPRMTVSDLTSTVMAPLETQCHSFGLSRASKKK